MNAKKIVVMGAALLGAGTLWAAEDAKPAEAQAGEVLTVGRSALCTGVADREPTGTQDKTPAEFKEDVGQVFFWLEVKAKTTPQTVKVVWTKDGKEEAAKDLSVNYERTRTWSSKKVWAGDWKVEAKDDKGTVLKSAEFKVAK